MRGNTVSIRGNVTRDAEVRRTQGGSNAVKWGMAWNNRRKDQNDQWADVPHYFDVECWMTDAQLGNVAPHIVKGAGCCVVDGHLEYKSWQDEQGGKRSKVVIRVDDPISGLMLRAPAQGGSGGAYRPGGNQAGGYQPQAQNGGYAPPQAAQGGYQQPSGQVYGAGQPPARDGGYGQQANGYAPAQPATQSIYDDDIPF